MVALLLKYFIVYVVMTLTDIIWAKYTHAVAGGNMIWGPLMAVGIILFGSFVTLSYVNDNWALIPAALGAYTGTWLSMWFEKRKSIPNY